MLGLRDTVKMVILFLKFIHIYMLVYENRMSTKYNEIKIFRQPNYSLNFTFAMTAGILMEA